jgi:hypothetical protein
MPELTNPSGTVWGYSDCEDEGFQGAFTSEEEAIEKGNKRFKNEPETGGVFWVQPGSYPPVTKVAPDYNMLAEHVVDLIGDNAHEEWDEAAEDFPDVSDDAKKELENELKAVIDAWMTRHLEAPCWEPTGDPKPIRIT